MNDMKEAIQEFRFFIESSFPESSNKNGFECVPESEDECKIDMRFRVSWHTQDDAMRSHKRSRPIIIEIPCYYLFNDGRTNLPKIHVQLVSFIKTHREKFYQNPANFSGDTSLPEKWTFLD